MMRKVFLIIILFSIVLVRDVLADCCIGSCMGSIINPLSFANKSERTNVMKEWDERNWLIGLKTEFLTKKYDFNIYDDMYYYYKYPSFSPDFGIKIGRLLSVQIFPIYLTIELSRGLNYNVSDIDIDGYNNIYISKGNVFWWRLELNVILKSLSKKYFSPYLGFGTGVNNCADSYELYEKKSSDINEVLIYKDFSFANESQGLGTFVFGFESFILNKLSIYLEVKLMLFFSDPMS